MNKSKLIKIFLIISLSSIIVFFNIYFFYSSFIRIDWLPKIIGQFLVSLGIGTLASYFIARSSHFRYLFSNIKSKSGAIILISIIIASGIVFFSGAKFSQNRFTAVTFDISISPAEEKSVLVGDVIFDNLPIDWQRQCQSNGNVKWANNKPILQSSPPQGAIRCTVFPRTIEQGVGGFIDIYLNRQLQGGEAVLTINNREIRINTQMAGSSLEPLKVSLPIPWITGMILGKAAEFVGYLILVYLVLGYFADNLLKNKKHFSENISWSSFFILSCVTSYLFVLFEWLFIITKPSSLSTSSISDKVEVFLLTGSVLAGCAFILLLLLLGLSKIFRSPQIEYLFKFIGRLVPVAIMTVMVILLFDNFTYTLFAWGITNSIEILRPFYLLLILFCFIYFFLEQGHILYELDLIVRHGQRNFYTIPAVFLFILASIFLSFHQINLNTDSNINLDKQNNLKLPNIILITGDGINASQTSIYDYERDTTPRIRSLVDTSLVAENAFTNAGNTAGSIISIYTSKYPTETRVLYPPDILKGTDSYQHLPGLLRSIGYYTIELTALRNADAFDLNLISGFDYANGRSLEQNTLFNVLDKYFRTETSYFIFEIFNRSVDRMGSIFFASKPDGDPKIIQDDLKFSDDQKKIAYLLENLKTNSKPVFSHVHWMGTHAGKFTPENESDIAINDKNILKFDAGVGQIIDAMTEDGTINNTMIIIGSDHGRMYFTTKRVPLLIHFPDGQFSGKIKSNVQNIDIAPTILDYLGIQKPAWMHGSSFLNSSPSHPAIYGVGVTNDVRENGIILSEYNKPPFYQFDYISAVNCNYWYRLDFDDRLWTTGVIADHTSPCSTDDRIPDSQMFSYMMNHLKEDKFDISSFADFSSVKK